MVALWAAAALGTAGAPPEVYGPVKPTVKPKPRPRAYAFQKRALPHVLCCFTTLTVKSEWARNANIRRAAGFLDTILLKPGERFSFNEAVGPRTERNGYRSAPVLAEGGRVNGIGGGICQVSGTLYNAALLAGLDITERHPHGSPSRYLPMGRDATVSLVDDLGFSNPHPFAVRLTLKLEGNRLTAAFEGAKPLPFQVRIQVRTQRLPDGRVAAVSERIITQRDAGETREALGEDTYDMP
jgi:vancomycin resistance protein YoaR